MKKKILISTVILIIVAAVVYGACTQLVLPHERDADGVSIFLSSKLKRDFRDYIDSDRRFLSLNDICVGRYYGRYSGYDVVKMSSDTLVRSHWERDVIFAGYSFKVSDNYLYVYKNGEFYSLEEAFNKGLLTDSDWGKLNGVMYG